MELRLGFLEARDETRNLKDVVKTLKREFPDLADVSILYPCLQHFGRANFYDVYEVCNHR